MNEFICPDCNTQLDTIHNPDIVYEKCPKCLGIFLDSGELDKLVIGNSSIDVELTYSLPDNFDNKFVSRLCPKCRKRMQCVQLLNISGVFFSHCESCEGFFLENLKIDQFNDYLSSITEHKCKEEYRDFIKDTLVRVDIEKGFSLYVFRGNTAYNPQNFVLIQAYYETPLNIALHISKENLYFKIAKLFQIKTKESHVENLAFDNYFKIYTSDEQRLNKIFNFNVSSQIMEFINSSLRLYKIKGTLQIYDNCIVYKEGPYADIPRYQDNSSFNRIIDNLVNLAQQIQNASR
jgi:uncharacterized protein